MEEKRERGKNYSETEKFTLLDIVEEYLYIIENKQTDNKNSKKKKETWNLIAKKFNAVQHTGVRSGIQLKLLYDNIKQKAKKDKADEKVERYKTGGGIFSKKVGELSEKYLQINGAAIIDIPNMYDSSAAQDINNVPIEVPVDIEVNNVQSEFLFNKPGIVTNTVSDLEFVLEPPDGNETATPPHTIPIQQTSSKNKTFYKKRKIVGKENIKLEILKVRLEKEIIEKDILNLNKEEKRLDIKQKKINMKIQLKKEGLTMSDSD